MPRYAVRFRRALCRAGCLVFTCLLILPSMAGCRKKTPEGKAFRFLLDSDPRQLDPQVSTDRSSVTMAAALFEGLARLDENGEAEPAAATWTVSEDRRTYTFTLRGGVFCNAQTANVVLMAIALGQGRWGEGAYYLIPISAYLAGAFLSEILPSPVRRLGFLRWDTYLVAFECLALFAVGFIPLSWPHHLVQVLVNFIASMQYNTFRQAEGIPMATTFCTNQLRQVGIGFAKAVRKGDREGLRRALFFLGMLGCFFLGGAEQRVVSPLLALQLIR